ncbi:hypothetical protein, partial [Saccharothrix sp. NRRL B-16314]|uniref:hypothetical protein n=1 Tax=Saccharothrix sp. NRRL B-16314 TaxID=1463825 RepID=UPI001E4EEA38
LHVRSRRQRQMCIRDRREAPGPVPTVQQVPASRPSLSQRLSGGPDQRPPGLSQRLNGNDR